MWGFEDPLAFASPRCGGFGMFETGPCICPVPTKKHLITPKSGAKFKMLVVSEENTKRRGAITLTLLRSLDE